MLQFGYCAHPSNPCRGGVYLLQAMVSPRRHSITGKQVALSKVSAHLCRIWRFGTDVVAPCWEKPQFCSLHPVQQRVCLQPVLFLINSPSSPQVTTQAVIHPALPLLCNNNINNNSNRLEDNLIMAFLRLEKCMVVADPLAQYQGHLNSDMERRG